MAKGNFGNKNLHKPHLKSPVIGDNGLVLEEGDNSKYLALNRELFNVPDLNRRDPEQVMQRLDWYFALYQRYDMKPTVAGMALAMHLSRQTLIAIAHDKPLGGKGNYTTLPVAVTDLIKRAYGFMENLWECYNQNGKMNPVTGIFLAKNNFGYVDKVEHIAAIGSNEEDVDVKALNEKYSLLEGKKDS